MEQVHPIEGIMKATLDSIKEMIDVNTILGDPVETPDGSVIMPISRVTFGFAAGGSEFNAPKKDQQDNKNNQDTEKKPVDLPFGGGSGAGISIQPVGFLIVNKEQTRLLPVDGNAVFDRLLDLAPQVMEGLLGKRATRRERVVEREIGEEKQ